MHHCKPVVVAAAVESLPTIHNPAVLHRVCRRHNNPMAALHHNRLRHCCLVRVLSSSQRVRIECDVRVKSHSRTWLTLRPQQRPRRSPISKASRQRRHRMALQRRKKHQPRHQFTHDLLGLRLPHLRLRSSQASLLRQFVSSRRPKRNGSSRRIPICPEQLIK